MKPVVEVSYGGGAGGRYPVLVAAGLLTDTGLARLAEQFLPGRRLAVITDRTVGRAVPHGLDVPTLVVAPGEASKSRTRWSALTDRLLDLGFGRDSGIIALGGGVVGDLAGFVAATYLRGVPWLMVPTSLLAMVDASVGGKTGVNTRQGKNLVGAFHPPVAVVADPAVLGTLHAEHLGAGLVEALKHGIVADAGYFAWIEEHAELLLNRNAQALTELITRSVKLKAAVVSEDERESGRRAILNAGHTVGHAIERVSGYATLHGDAVGIGLVVEAMLAQRLGVAGAGVFPAIRATLQRLGRPFALDSAWTAAALLEAMQYDKKGRGGTIRFALPTAIGTMARDKGQWTVPAEAEQVRRVLSSAASGAAR
ncbi:MAG: 3-dehydroquinate synthase [Gemmatimonadales bacterium]